MTSTILGKMVEASAHQFIAENVGASLGSKAPDGMRRVGGGPELLPAFVTAGGIASKAPAGTPDKPCVTCNKQAEPMPMPMLATPSTGVMVGTILSKRLKRWFGLVPTEECDCTSLMDLMNEWGPEGCQMNRDYISNRMWGNREVLLDRIPKLSILQRAGFALLHDQKMEGNLRAVLDWMIDTSIAEGLRSPSAT